MRKTIASAAAAAAILTAAGGVALAPAIAGAQDETPVVEQTRIDGVLDGLVTDGTLTQDQRDAVETALRDAKPKFDRRGGSHGRGHGRPGGASILGELGIDRSSVRQGVTDGLTLGEIADANGSSAQALEDALAERFNTKIDAAIETGRIDAQTGEERRAEIQTQIEDLVNGEVDVTNQGHRGLRGHPGPGAHTADEDLGA